MATEERMFEFERLKGEGKDLGDGRRATEQQLFDEAEERIDQFLFTKRRLKLIAEMPLPPGGVNPDHYHTIKPRK